jgi:hypothetical protein
MDTEFENLIEDSLRQHAAAVVIPPGLTGMADRARRQRQRRQFAFRGALGAGTAAGTAAAIVAISAGAPKVLPAQTTAYVVSRTEHALASSAARSIQYVRMRWSSNMSADIQPVPSDSFAFSSSRYAANWYYGGTWRTAVYGANGKLSYGLGVIDRTSRTMSLALVDYQGKTWQQFIVATTGRRVSPQPVSSPSADRVAGCAPTWPGLSGFTPSASASWAEQVRHLLGCGLYAMAERRIVDGVNAIELVPTRADKLAGVARADIWVNPSTYLPVRILIVTSGPRTWLQYDFRWLPLSRANLAELRSRVPAGFRQNAPPRVIPPPPPKAPGLHRSIMTGSG